MAAVHAQFMPFICRACRMRNIEIWPRHFSSIPVRRLDTPKIRTPTSDPTVDQVIRKAASQERSSTRTKSSTKPAVPKARSKPANKSSAPPKSSAAAQLPYFVSRTPSNQLPVYHDTRNGGTRKETIIRKISGDARPLRDALRDLLKVDSERVWIGTVTGHVYVKGHHKYTIDDFLKKQGF